MPPGSRTRRIAVERGLLARAGEEIAALGEAGPHAVLFDPAVEAAARDVARQLDAELCLPVPGGEAAKQLATVEALATELERASFTRRSRLVAVGGGVLTDLVGFLASIYLRGVECVLVPSSLLAMCDAAIGGKNGVDLGGRKNRLGTIEAPRAVLIDPDLLRSLPAPELEEGLVEVIKMAAILDAAAFQALDAELPRLLARDLAALARTVEDAVRQKCEVVRDDEREQGRRMLLNFGHTVGHALETLSGFRVRHGEAVAMGMVAELRMAPSPASAELLATLRAWLERMRYPRELPADVEADRLWEVMRSDKKASAGRVRVAVPEAPGRGAVREVSRADLERAFG